MSPDILLALFAFAFVMTVTPGPNNLMLMASGVNFGMRRSVPHVAGVTLGVVFLVLVVGAGLGQALARHPEAAAALKAASVGYMLWLAWRIATAAPPEGAAPAGRPLGFWQAAAFQWVNPKAWGMAVTAIAAYAPAAGWAGVAPVAFAFLLVGPPCNVLWVAMGQALRRLLADRRALRAFNLGMAALLLASLWPVLRG
jgi:threonine/homoserine/homoserine lactone efflux protein